MEKIKIIIKKEKQKLLRSKVGLPHSIKEPAEVIHHEVVGSILGLTWWIKDLTLLWLWCRPAAVALIRPLA